VNGAVVDRLQGDVVAAARGLLGCLLTTTVDGQETSLAITEVEAYGGGDDPASHAYRGRTTRNASMFGPAGTLYVYRIYGMHWCANVVTGSAGAPSAVLIRGGVPVSGIETMIKRRGRTTGLVDGPGKICEALAITGDDNGTSLLDGPVRLGEPIHSEPINIERGPRIGITAAVDRPWRFIALDTFGSSLAST